MKHFKSWHFNLVIFKYVIFCLFRPFKSCLYCCSLSLFCIQCDQIGRFLKALGNKFSFQCSPNIWCLFGYFEKHNFISKNYSAYFLDNFCKNWATFYSNHWSHCLHRSSFVHQNKKEDGEEIETEKLVAYNQCDQMGRFFNFLVAIFHTKSAQILL